MGRFSVEVTERSDRQASGDTLSCTIVDGPGDVLQAPTSCTITSDAQPTSCTIVSCSPVADAQPTSCTIVQCVPDVVEASAPTSCTISSSPSTTAGDLSPLAG